MAGNIVLVGCNGNATIAGRGMRYAAWSASGDAETYDSTGFSSGGYRECVQGLKSMSGTVSGFATKGSATDQPNFAALGCGTDPVAIVLTADTGCTYSFNGYVTNIPIDVRVDDDTKMSFHFRSTGVISESWVES